MLKSKKCVLFYISLFITVGIAVLIFILSSKPAEVSNSQSLWVTEKLLFWFDEEDISKYNSLIRTYAHAFIYSIFELSLIFLLRVINWGTKRIFKVSILIVAFYAIFDELHQNFVEGRSTQLYDVAVDMTGALIAFGVFWLIYMIANSRKSDNL
ncbi:VanZ family protein [Vallitalea okinawensis]|uniref:VanZ family protein n=1 Tax=Vallitalea okinawensis TaxID=2078660 RepID=UPI000CFD69D0|nr:VanZ family protein [Vallitalea okinawensis]